MKIKIDFPYQNIVSKIESDFPFDTIYSIMDACKWRYYYSDSTPTIDMIKSMLYGSIEEAKEGVCVGTGGFDVDFKNDNYNIKFIIGTFFFTKKSSEWDGSDLLYLDNFIKRVSDSEMVLNSPFMLIRDFEKVHWFKTNCDSFIDSGEDFKYDKKLGILFTKESSDADSNTMYELNFVGVDKDYKV